MPKNSRQFAKTWMAISLNYPSLVSVPNDYSRCYSFTDREAQALLMIADYLRFWRRYEQPSPDIKTFSENLANRVIYSLLNPQECSSETKNCTYHKYTWPDITYTPPIEGHSEIVGFRNWVISEDDMLFVMSTLEHPAPEFSYNLPAGESTLIHFQTAIAGGVALVIIDGLLNTAVNLNTDVIAIPPEVSGEKIFEIDPDTDTDRVITVRFEPRVDNDFNVIGFGGGINGITVCNSEGGCSMFELRQSENNSCLLEQSIDGGVTWTTAFDYSLCQNTPEAVTKVYRFDKNSYEIQESADNGVTWINSEKQPNNTAPMIQAPAGVDKWEAACFASQNVKDICIAWLNSTSETSDIGSLIAKFHEAFWLLPFAVDDMLSVWFASIIVEFRIFGELALLALLEVQAIWDDLACHIYCEIGDDLAIPAGGARRIASHVISENVPVIGNVVGGIIRFIGDSGMTNACRVPSEIENYASGAGECETCPEQWCASWYVGSELQFAGTPFVTKDEIGIPSNSYVWGGHTFYEWKIDCGVMYNYISDVVIEFEGNVQSGGDSITGGTWDASVTPSGLPADMPIQVSGGKLTIPVNSIYGHLSIALTSGGYAGHITKITVYGEGESPFGNSNC